MTLINLVRRFPATNKQSFQPVSADPPLEINGNVPIDQNNYIETSERRYDVRGFANMHLEISNDGANGVTYSIGKASKEVDDVATLSDSDFTDLLTDFDVASGIVDVRDIVDISPESTAIRIQLKRTTAGQDTAISGVASFN